MKEKRNLVIEHGSKEVNSLKNMKIESVEFKHTTELFGSALNIPIIVKGTNKQGKESKKELYYPSVYCPFCGEKL